MIPARYCTIFKPQKQNSLTMKKKEIFFLLHTQQVLPFFFSINACFPPPLFQPNWKLNQQRTQNGKNMLQMVFSKCKHFSQQN